MVEHRRNRLSEFRWQAALGMIVLLLAWPGMLRAKNVRKLSFHDLDGHPTRLRDFEGRIVVLNFWATWCGPCREELPRIEEISQQYASSNVRFILLSVDEKARLDQVRKFAAERKLTVPVWAGADVDQVEQLSGANIVPATLIIDEHGEVIRAINGEAQAEDVQQALDWLLSGRKGGAPATRVKRY